MSRSLRKKKHEEHENHERWLVSYADFITLLFAFFVVLYATSSQNQEKEKKFEDSIRANFNIVSSDAKPNMGPVVGQVFDPFDMIQKRNVRNEDLEESIVRILRKNMTDEERLSAIESIDRDPQGVRITLAANNFFPSGSTKLRMQALQSLDKIAKILKLTKRTIVIEGHTDDQGINGNADTNWELASLRATSVVRYLIKYQQLDGKKLSAASYADQRPIAPNDSEANRAKNRRIEILILNNEDEP